MRKLVRCLVNIVNFIAILAFFFIGAFYIVVLNQFVGG